jgi:Leucine-rich repeat (LRR) protein
LNNNKLDSVPYEIRKLKKLGYLLLSNNNVNYFPPEIVKLKKLYKVDL